MNWSELLNPNRARRSSIEPDHRIEFERDLDRAVFSTPVKRLQDKAQVFPLEPHDAVRTRLTHSMEVSAVARGIAIGVGKWLAEQGELDANRSRSVEAIAATAGLLHDLGNPPFGHSGEEAIRGWFKRRGAQSLREQLQSEQLVQDFLRFEGNAQTLRLVARLQILADYYGLNLTFGSLSAMCKYTSASHEVDHGDQATKKTGYFASESELVERIRSETGTGPRRNPIAFLVEAADDIVYAVADVEDAVKKGVFTWNELRELLGDETAPLKESLERQDRILKSDGSGDPIAELPDDVKVSAFRTAAIGVLVPSVSGAFSRHYDEVMNGKFTQELISACSAEPLVAKLREIGIGHVYCTPSTLKLEIMGRHVICDLMDVFWEAAERLPVDREPTTKDFAGKAGALLSQNYRRVFRRARKDQKTLPELYHRYQLVTDWVCGMTDSFAKRLHAELFNG